MKLLCELTEEVQTLEEEVNGKKNLYISGVYLQAGIKNRNGRIYPSEILENEVNRYVAEEVTAKRAYGELNHPPTPKIDLERASHRVVELVREGNNFIGKSLILKTPMGDIARGLIEGDCNLGVSSRGMGTLKKNAQGIVEVQSDFRLATAADIVSNPSAPDAFVTGIMENVDWVYDEQNGWQAQQVVEQVKAALQHSRKALNEDSRLKAFALFIERVKNVELK